LRPKRSGRLPPARSCNRSSVTRSPPKEPRPRS
jgi:hypothetical protein